MSLPSAGDVSDAFPIARRDGGADVYYVTNAVVRRTTAVVFSHEETETTVRRRTLDEDGTLGPEQIVTSNEVGDVAKPQPRRLADGRLALMFTIQRSREERSLALSVLDGDAPH